MTKQILPPTYVLVSSLVIILLGVLVPGATIFPFPWNLAGLIPLLIGVWLNLSADQALKQVQTTVKPFEEPTSLITSGAYRLSRNPMYLGFVLILLGAAMLFKGWIPVLVVPAFTVLMEMRFIHHEEKALEDKFDQTWRAYKRRVRRWI